MNNGRRQDLTQAFASLISMMLRAIRARGWRGLKDLPEMWRAVMFVRQQEKALAELMADFLAGKLPPPPPMPEPAPWTDPREWQAACAQPPASPRPAARSDPAARDRQQSAERPSLPAADGASPAPALPHASRRAAVRPWPALRTPHPFAVLALPAGIIATGRCS